MLQRPLCVLALCLSACTSVPTGPGPSPASPQPTPGVSSPTPTAKPVSPSPSPSAGVPGFPADFPRGNQRLATGDRLGWGISLNQLDAQGEGVLLWALGNPAGQRFKNFRPTVTIARNPVSSNGQQWITDAQGNGLLFQTEAGMGLGMWNSAPILNIWSVKGFEPQGQPEVRQGQSLAKHAVDAQGNGWVMITETPPEGVTYTREGPVPSWSYTRLYRLNNYQLAPRPADTRTDLVAGQVMDAQGNGFSVYSEYISPGDKLWLQSIRDFQNAGDPILLAANGGNLRVHEQNGQGIISWLVRDELNRPVEMAFQEIRNHQPAERLPVQPLASSAQDPLLLTAQFNAAGDAWLVWTRYSQAIPPQSSLGLQTLRQGQWQPEVTVRAQAGVEIGGAKLAVDATGRGLLVWSEQKQSMNREFVSNQGTQIQAVALSQGQLDGPPQLLSETGQGSVDAWSMNLAPEGHGLIAWTQFVQTCPGDLNCNLDQSVWARAVYDYRIP
ncbi:MAG: hypothetical protein ACO1RX_22980 [Candidatus Sericytochromatia bacterium]